MSAPERVHEHIAGDGQHDSPYDLSEFPTEWHSPNKPFETLAANQSIQDRLRTGEEVFINYEDSTFIVSLQQREQEDQEPFVFIKVDVIMPVDTNEAVSGAIRLDLNEIRRYDLPANRIVYRFEEALGLREKKY